MISRLTSPLVGSTYPCSTSQAWSFSAPIGSRSWIPIFSRTQRTSSARPAEVRYASRNSLTSRSGAATRRSSARNSSDMISPPSGEQRLNIAVRVERLQVVQALADADELHRQVQL